MRKELKKIKYFVVKNGELITFDETEIKKGEDILLLKKCGEVIATFNGQVANYHYRIVIPSIKNIVIEGIGEIVDNYIHETAISKDLLEILDDHRDRLIKEYGDF